MRDQITIALGSGAQASHPARRPEPVITVQTTGDRISLHLSAHNNGPEEAGVMLKPAEARELAKVLNAQASAVASETV